MIKINPTDFQFLKGGGPDITEPTDESRWG